MSIRMIITNGSGGVGKDLFVDIFKKYTSKTDVVKISTIDPIKMAYKALFGCEDKNEKVRKDLSDLLKWTEDKGLNTAYKYIDDYYNSLAEFFNNVTLIIDSREPKNIDYYKKKYEDVNTLLITNPRIPIIENNTSDKNVLEYNYDDYIVNDGTIDEYTEKIKRYIDKYGY